MLILKHKYYRFDKIRARLVNLRRHRSEFLLVFTNLFDIKMDGEVSCWYLPQAHPLVPTNRSDLNSRIFLQKDSLQSVMHGFLSV